MKRRICALILALGMLITSASALTVEQARDLLNEYYIDEIPGEVLAHDTIDEILAALGDPYTEYYTAEELAGFYAAIEDVQIVGIGIRAYYRADGVLITQVAPDGPAEEGGLQAGDWIITIDGHDTRGAAAEDVDTWILGAEGTQVALTVLRGEETFDLALTRRQVIFPTTLLEKIEDGIGWISCSSFGSNTFAQFYQILSTYDSQVDSWVVDLRGNTGGSALTAVLAAGCFGGWNSGVYTRDGSGRYYGYLSTAELVSAVAPDLDLTAYDENGYLTQNTVCVLVDRETASAAEFFGVAIRDSGAGLIIGEQTYGKGVAQTLLTKETADMEGFFDEGDGLKVTSERCFSMEGSTNDQVGVLPHVLVNGDLADEVAGLLLAPCAEDSDALILRDVCRTSSLVQHFAIPMELLRAPENAAAVEQLLSSLTPGVTCQFRRDGALWSATIEEAAEACGMTFADKRFSDVAGSAYADDIEVMHLYGIVGGYGDNTFRPAENLSRAEMCALFVKAMRYPILEEGAAVFSDVDEDIWYAPYVNTMYRLGLVNGDGDGTFRPENEITHEEFLVLLGRVAQWLDMDYYELMRHDGIYEDVLPTAEALEQQYGNFQDWAREEIWLCDGEYAWTDLASIDPDVATTREEAVESMYKLFCNSGLLAH